MQQRLALTVWILLLFVYCLPGISVGQINKSDLQELEENIKSYVDLKVEGISRQLTQMDRRFGAVESRLNSIDNRLNQIDQRFNTLDGRIDTVSNILTGRIDIVFTWIAGLIIITVGAFAIMLRQQHRLDKQVGQIDLRLTHVENWLKQMNTRLTHVENRLDSIDSKLDKLLEQSSSRIITS